MFSHFWAMLIGIPLIFYRLWKISTMEGSKLLLHSKYTQTLHVMTTATLSSILFICPLKNTVVNYIFLPPTYFIKRHFRLCFKCFFNTDIITPLLFINKLFILFFINLLKVFFTKCVKFENVIYKFVFLKGQNALF